MILARLFSKIREFVRRVGAVRVTLALILLVLVGVYLLPSGVWDIWSTKYTSITITGNQTCGILPNGTLRCWGTRRHPPADERFVAVAPGSGNYGCGLREDGSVSCWGYIRQNYKIHSPDPPPEVSDGPFTSITGGGDHFCGLRPDGTAVCWGLDRYGETSPPDGERFTEISAGTVHTCGLRMDGTSVCWGWSRIVRGPDSPPKDVRFKAISSGSDFACAIRWDDDITCWGWMGGFPFRQSPYIERVYGGGWPSYINGPFTALSSGADHACALRPSGEVYCWGFSAAHEEDYYGDDPVSGEEFVSISSGRHYNCALRQTGTAKCWGGGRQNRIRPSE